MKSFDFLTAGRIRFGRGQSARTVESVTRFGRNVLLVRGRSVPWATTLGEELRAAGCEVTEVISQGEPTLSAVDAACEIARRVAIDVVVAIGGGAVIDLGKAVAALAPGDGPALRHLESVGEGLPLVAAPLPFIAVPTTAGTGAEVTKNAVIAVEDAGRKVSLRDDRMLPDVAIVDPALTDNAPQNVTLASGLDALTQVVEPYLTPRANPMTDALSRAAIPVALSALPRLAAGEDPDARDDMCFVSLCGGLALANSGLGAVHGLAGVLGGRLGAPHGLICGRLLGPVLSANAQAVAQAGGDTRRFEEMATMMAATLDIPAEDPFGGLSDLLDRWGVLRLSEWITQDVDLDSIASEAAQSSSMKANPCVLPSSALITAMQQAC